MVEQNAPQRQGDAQSLLLGIEEREQLIAAELYRFVIAAIFTLPLLANLIGDLLGWRIFFFADPAIQFVWATIVQFWAGWHFYERAYESLRAGLLHMDLLVTLGISAAYGFSVYHTFVQPETAIAVHGGNVYYEAAAGVITLVILGRLLELIAWGLTSKAIRKLIGLQPGATIQMVESALVLKAPIQRTVDDVLRYFLPTVIAFAILTFLGWYIVGGASAGAALLNAIAVLVVASPGAIGLVAPTAMMVGIGLGAKNGILFSSTEQLERAHRIGTIVLDQTDSATPGQHVAGRFIEGSAEAIADLETIGIAVLPSEETSIVAEVRKRGGVVAIVGSGVKATPTVAPQDVGIAMGISTDIAMETAGVTLMAGDLRALPRAIQLSRSTMRTIHSGLFWVCLYHVAAVPAAAVGLLHPITASAVMALATLGVVVNSLWLKRVAQKSRVGRNRSFRSRTGS